MSRRRKPSWPLAWPKMKVRGSRRKRKLAMRIQTIYYMRGNFSPYQNPATNLFEYRFLADANGEHFVKYEVWRDGYGRSVPKPTTPKSTT